ncbi:2-dehydropantoate 2-reductase [Shewanella inventionis]|uniref:2-dehydropantoate 2-reductase n=1 Tax=Shewanella inventionis TaxID=1738770 RepID=A0ABQ1J871_9GAMM|nr:2-dehydropantoate 2-reductase [Shewanella inventionis]MCL1158782.1 2-dehydropantoate 2-reductase [Shewanella inventionis]UAL42924.1 2-dehydropantoate 2-reductase [Shewanella inventionis]GGB61066.1 2-dehydropantoate 2-reductase [Shewanella inventionis]
MVHTTAPACSPNIAILGAGAIGQLMYHQLCHTSPNQPSHDVVLISRQSHTQLQPLRFTDIKGQIHNTDAVLLGTKDPRLNEVKLLLVCVKAYQVEEALIPLLSKLSPQCHIILLHNGLGPHIAVSTALRPYPEQGLTLGTTSLAALAINQWHIKHTGVGVTQLGHYCGHPLANHLHARIQAIASQEQPVEWHQPVLAVLWQKLAVNAVINPLTALHQCANGQLADDEYREQITLIINELVAVAQCDGIELDPTLLTERVYKVIALTSANFSSMYQDVTHHRTTEIDYINGYICQRAQHHKLNVPVNQCLATKVASLS